MKRILVEKDAFELCWFTGRVLSATKNLETRVHGGGGGGYTNQGSGYTAPVTVTSTTTVHDQIFLAGKDGAERAFQLQDFDVACRESNLVTVAWAVKVGKQQGPYFLVVNHTTQASRYKNATVRSLVAPSMMLYAIGMLAGLVIPFAFNVGGCATIVLSIAIPVAMYSRRATKRTALFKEQINVKEMADA